MRCAMVGVILSFGEPYPSAHRSMLWVRSMETGAKVANYVNIIYLLQGKFPDTT